MATAGEDPSIFITISCDGRSKIQEMIVKMRDDFRKKDKDGLKFLTEVCFEQKELESVGGFRGCLCDILHKYELPISFVAKVLHEIGRKDLVREYLLSADVKSRSPTECLQLLEERLSDESTLLNDDKLDPIIMLFRFTLYRIAQSFSRKEEQDFKQFIYGKYGESVFTDQPTNSVEEMLHVLEGEELLTPENTEIFDTFLANFPGYDELSQEVRRHLENFKAKFTDLSTVADGVRSLNIQDERPSSPNIEWYNMSSKVRGYCVILVQTGDRTGANKECDKLEETFEKLRFKVEVHQNFTSKTIFAIMRKYNEEIDHSDYDSFACFIVGHGQMHDKKDFLQCSDGNVVNVGDVLNIMNPPSLLKKPKLFFINICRYDPRDGQSLPELERSQPTDASAERSMRSHSSLSSFEGDVLKAYSTASGTKSNRSKKEGAWYITELCKVIEEFKDQLSLMHMLTEVHQRVCKKKNPGLNLKISQVPQCCNQLNKLVYFRDRVL